MPQFRVRFIEGAVTRAVQVTGESFSLELLYSVRVVNLRDGYNVVCIMDGVTDLRTGPLVVAQPAAPALASRIKIILVRQ